MKKWIDSHPSVIVSAALFIILLLGFAMRVKDLSEWKENSENTFFNGQPLPASADGYIYLRMARDLMEGAYDREDSLRNAPASRARPTLPPLLSVLTAWSARLTGISPDWIALFLPPLLGVLLVFPVYAWGRRLGGRIAGLVAAAVGVLAPYYAYRSGIGFFDTDCLNVVLSLSIAYCFLSAGLEGGRSGIVYLLSGLVGIGLFLWWWDQSPEGVLAITLIPLSLALLGYYCPSRPKTMALLISGVLIVAAALFLYADYLHPYLNKLLKRALLRFHVLSKLSDGIFPAQIVSTQEQVRASLRSAVNATTSNAWLFAVGSIGLVWLAVCRFKSILFLASLIMVSAFSFIFAERFLVFFTPLFALGFGFFVAKMWDMRSRLVLFRGFSVALVAAGIGFPLQALSKGTLCRPVIESFRIHGIAKLEQVTPTNSIVWAWWDNGYAIQYWARRRTISDGSVHGGSISVYNALPLATDNERLSANFMLFFAARGFQGIRNATKALKMDPGSGLKFLLQVLRGGPVQARPLLADSELDDIGRQEVLERWLEFFFPSDAPPVYLYLDSLSLRSAYWWYWFGTWDFSKNSGIHPFHDLFTDVTLAKETITGSPDLLVDVRKGFLQSARGSLPLCQLRIRTTTATLVHDYPYKPGMRFEMVEPGKFGAAMSSDIAESMFNKLFLRHDESIVRFRPIVLQAPFFQIWEVIGEEKD